MGPVLDQTKEIEEIVRELAKAHQVEYDETIIDTLAHNITRLCGDDVPAPDEVQGILIALRRANHITGSDFVQLQTAYLRQRKNRGV